MAASWTPKARRSASRRAASAAPAALAASAASCLVATARGPRGAPTPPEPPPPCARPPTPRGPPPPANQRARPPAARPRAAAAGTRATAAGRRRRQSRRRSGPATHVAVRSLRPSVVVGGSLLRATPPPGVMTQAWMNAIGEPTAKGALSLVPGKIVPKIRGGSIGPPCAPRPRPSMHFCCGWYCGVLVGVVLLGLCG
jgi:hypothetical protein